MPIIVSHDFERYQTVWISINHSNVGVGVSSAVLALKNGHNGRKPKSEEPVLKTGASNGR